ncbi:ATP-binding protein [Desulfosarcina ovata]|uniref:histidine kinase n=1 Tax=Desulfosarcina ovata subsp. ovata TaxID=2752305 RepID=A0A5K8AAK8_9BACT|nr:ATP-binding protein [Desulfosarcina ovata]BBO89635.1 hypothetical protein DSCOOX_28150 [Desulfosarcina ovata subsp. ovata]
MTSIRPSSPAKEQSQAIKKTLLIILPIFLLVLGCIATVYWFELRNHQRAVLENEKASVLLAKQITLRALAPVIADLRFLASEVASSGVLGPETTMLAKIRSDMEARFINFSSAHSDYDQIRIIDRAGMEVVRINQNNGAPMAVADRERQAKKHRYYFAETMRLTKGGIYVSPLDLNIEHNQLETPRKPMIRFATPIYSRQEVKSGMVIINYTAQHLLNQFSPASKGSDSQLMLLNADGYWLKGATPEDEWGFMYPNGQNLTLGRRYPELWARINTVKHGQMVTDQGIFTFGTIYPLEECPGCATTPKPNQLSDTRDYSWIIVSQHASIGFRQGQNRFFMKAVLASVVAFLVLVFLSFRLTVSDFHRRSSEARLRRSKATLAQAVVAKTSELQSSNRALRTQIDERLKVETALRESEEKYRTLIETMREGICLINGNGRFAFVNRQFCAMLGYSQEEIVGHEYREFLDPVNLKKLNREREKRMAGEAEPYDLKWIKKNGKPVLTYISPAALYDTGGEFSGSFAVVTDITEQKTLDKEKAGLEMQLRQAQKMEAIGVLAGGIAHDFNNILMPIIGYAELIRELLPDDHDAWGYIHPILEASRRAKELVAQILSFSRQSNDELKPTPIAPLVAEPLKLLKASIPSNIEIEPDIDAKDAMIMANPVQIHQVVMNLCTNAYHAMENTGGKLSVSLKKVESSHSRERASDRQPDRFACLTISDTGPGIKPEYLSRIFEPYFTTKEQSKGTGLGLSVVHGIVNACNGEIRVESHQGKGTTFYVFLPLLSSEAAGKSDDQHKILPGGAENILLVDDEAPIVQLEKRVLERLGYTVTTRMSSVDALEIFRIDPYRFDLVITDLTMPNLTGIDLAKAMTDIRPDLPVLMLTGFSEQLNRRMVENAGIRRVLMKPVLAKDLAAAIRSVFPGE